MSKVINSSKRTKVASTTICGKEAKVFTLRKKMWHIVPGTTQKLGNTSNVTIRAWESKEEYTSNFYMSVVVRISDTEAKKVTFPVDLECDSDLYNGCYIDPESFRVFKRKHSETGVEVTKCCGKVLDSSNPF